MSHDNGPRDQVFLVRFWPGQTAGNRQLWRGSILNVASGNKLYVSGLAEVVEFISTELPDVTPEQR